MAELRFRNHYTSRLYVAIAFLDPGGCPNDGRWGTRGWWAIDPENEAHVLNTGNRYAYYYAEAIDGVIWAGHYGPMYVRQAAFDSCLNIGDNSPETRVVGLRQSDLGDADVHYVNLVL